MTTTRLIAASDVARIIQARGLDALMDDLTHRLRNACQTFSEGHYSVPARSGFHYSLPAAGLIEWMPVMQKGADVTLKMVAYHPNNPNTHQLPTILSSILVFDTENGHLKTLVDGTFLTSLRTGAASAVASEVLASPDSRVLGLIGCGAQAVTQLHALSRIFPIKRVRHFDVDVATMDSFALRVAPLGLDNIILEPTDPEVVLSTADIISTCTSVEIAQGPVFQDGPVKPHLHINAVGSDFPGKTELPRKFLERALVCPDFRAQAIVEGECQQMREDEVGPELAQFVRNSKKYRVHQQSLTVFDSTGWALEDHLAAQMLSDSARELGIGSEIELESLSADPKDPYGFAFENSTQQTVSRALSD